MQYNTIYIKFKKYKTVIAEGYQEEFHPLLSLEVSVFLFHRNIYLGFEPSFVFVCIFVYINMYVCCGCIHTYITMYIVCMYAYICIFLEQKRCIYARSDQAILTRCPLDFFKNVHIKGNNLSMDLSYLVRNLQYVSHTSPFLGLFNLMMLL